MFRFDCLNHLEMNGTHPMTLLYKKLFQMKTLPEFLVFPLDVVVIIIMKGV